MKTAEKVCLTTLQRDDNGIILKMNGKVAWDVTAEQSVIMRHTYLFHPPVVLYLRLLANKIPDPFSSQVEEVLKLSCLLSSLVQFHHART